MAGCCGKKKMEAGGKVTKPADEKKRIKDMAKEERMKKILTEDMNTFGPKEESKPMKKAYGGKVKMKKGGMVKRDGCAVKGKTKGRMV